MVSINIGQYKEWIMFGGIIVVIAALTLWKKIRYKKEPKKIEQQRWDINRDLFLQTPNQATHQDRVKEYQHQLLQTEEQAKKNRQEYEEYIKKYDSFKTIDQQLRQQHQLLQKLIEHAQQEKELLQATKK